MKLPLGFTASAVEAGIKYSNRLDLGLIRAQPKAVGAALFTTNQVKAAPVLLSAERIEQSQGQISAILFNSGCANAATGEAGMQAAVETSASLAELLGEFPGSVLVASTGVIGVLLPSEKIQNALPALVKKLSPDGMEDFSNAILTTDTKTKTASAEISVNGKTVRFFGVAKGSGMIHPNMATMLALILTDADVSQKELKESLRFATDRSFHRISVDGDTSTNDSLFCLASGQSGVRLSSEQLREGLLQISCSLSLQIVRDGEGAKKLLEVAVRGARAEKEAEQLAQTVASSLLVRTAVAGGDPNWGRILAAAGRSGVELDLEKIEIFVGGVCLFKKGAPVSVSLEEKKKAFASSDVLIRIELHQGKAEANYWTCDLTEGYIRINADYTT